MNKTQMTADHDHPGDTVSSSQPITTAGAPPAATACSIIIPVHNKASLTRQCLETLLAQSDLGIEREIIVVDDGSSDLTPRLLQSYAARITVITNSSGQGFAGACNAGAAAATKPYLVFLNNDTIPRRRWLAELVRYARAHPAAGLIGAKLLFPDDTVQHAGVAIGHDRYPRHLYIGFPGQHPAVNKSRQFAAVTAACVLIRHEVWSELGGFDTGYHNGWEDVDLCLRARAAGYEVHYCHESVVYHLESVSRDVRAPEERANRERYAARWRDKVIPDDVAYYLDDDLISIKYNARYPINFSISPLLATWTIDESLRDSDRLLTERARQVTILLRNNIVLNTRVHEAELRALDAEQRARNAYQQVQDAGLVIDSPPAIDRERESAGVAPAPPPLRIIGGIERPGLAPPPVTEPVLTVAGWALSPVGIARVETFIDDALVGPLGYGLLRPDIAVAHPGYPDAEHGGFSGDISLTDLRAGPHELCVRIFDTRGRYADATTTIEIAAPVRHEDRIIGHCDYPTPGSRTTVRHQLTVRGWALSPHGIRGIQAFVDGEPRGRITYGEAREDIPLVHPAYADAAHSGFSGSLDVVDLVDGSHELRLRIVANDDREATLRVEFVIDSLQRRPVEMPPDPSGTYA
ncbi:MAG: glycosyltransferase family 2 protein [Chloroflexota bacterium]|nr:glycosyltransferase family 2 protein [Chloroflexota bacterium]